MIHPAPSAAGKASDFRAPNVVAASDWRPALWSHPPPPSSLPVGERGEGEEEGSDGHAEEDEEEATRGRGSGGGPRRWRARASPASAASEMGVVRWGLHMDLPPFLSPKRYVTDSDRRHSPIENFQFRQRTRGERLSIATLSGKIQTNFSC